MKYALAAILTIAFVELNVARSRPTIVLVTLVVMGVGLVLGIKAGRLPAKRVETTGGLYL